jgi:hypothetical protein
VVATFTGGDPSQGASDFTATVTWGDSHTSPGTVAPDGRGGFTVSASNTYAEERSYPVAVTVTDAFGSSGMAQSTANVADPSVAPRGGFNILAVAGVASRLQTVATFTDPGGPEPLADYSAMINWGDNTQPAPGTITGPVNGVFTVQASHTYAQAGNYTLTATLRHDAATDVMVTGTAQVLVPAFDVAVTGFPSPVIAGNQGTFTVTTQDQLGETVTGYRGTLHFASSDPVAVLPPDYTFTAADNGSRQFNARLLTAGTQSITATDTADPSIAGSQVGILVRPANHFMVSGFPSPVTAGTAGVFTVTIMNADGVRVTDYTGRVHFSSSDPRATLPGDYTFTAADMGSHTFGAVLRTAGTRSITVTDTGFSLVNGSQSGIIVNPSPVAANFILAGFPSPVQAGTPGMFRITAYDAYGNVSTPYAGTVTFRSSDPQADLPGPYTFTGAEQGTQTFMATLKTVGTQSLVVADTGNGATGSQDHITVTPGVAVAFRVFGYPSPVTVGTVNTFTVTALDAYGNTGALYGGTVDFTSSDLLANLPGRYTFIAADNGTHAFAAVFNTPGVQSLTATDTNDPLITGTQEGIVVVPGPGPFPGGGRGPGSALWAPFALVTSSAPASPGQPVASPAQAPARVGAGGRDGNSSSAFLAATGGEDGPLTLPLSSRRARDRADAGFAEALGLVLGDGYGSLLPGALVEDLARARLG